MLDNEEAVLYTLIRDPDGTVTLRTHVDLGQLPCAEARRLLGALRPVLEVLRERSRADHPVSAGPGPRDTAAESIGTPEPLPRRPELLPIG
jgi:hypothetical protein